MYKACCITSITGDRSKLVDPLFVHPNIDYFAFVDKTYNNIKVWNQKKIYDFSTIDNYSNRRNAKIYKILPHLFLPGYDYYIWCDANCIFKEDPVKLIEQYSVDAIFFYHYRYNTIFNDIEKIIKRKKDHLINIDNYIEFLSNSNYIDDMLLQFSMFITTNSHESMLMRLIWWELICKFSSRDQISGPYAIKKSKISYHIIKQSLGHVTPLSSNNIGIKFNPSKHD